MEDSLNEFYDQQGRDESVYGANVDRAEKSVSGQAKSESSFGLESPANAKPEAKPVAPKEADPNALFDVGEASRPVISPDGSKKLVTDGELKSLVKAATDVIKRIGKDVHRNDAYDAYNKLRDKKKDGLTAQTFYSTYTDEMAKLHKGNVNGLLAGDENNNLISTPEEAYTETVEGRKEKYNPDQFTLDFREGTTNEEKRTAIRLQRTTTDGFLRGSNNSLLANAIATAFKTKGVFTFVGQQITSSQDLAAIAQVFRNSSYETLRYFFTKNGVIVGQTAVSSRLPGISSTFPASEKQGWIPWVTEKMSQFDADGYWLVHNHPGGDVRASQEDMAMQAKITLSVPGFQGHVIINHNKYGLLSVGKGMELIDFEEIPYQFSQGEDTIHIPSVPHPILGKKINNGYSIVEVARELQIKDGYILIIGQRGLTGISGLLEIPVDTPKPKLAFMLRRFANQTGSNQLFAILPDKSENALSQTKLDTLKTWAAEAVHKGFLVNAINERGYSAVVNMGDPPSNRLYFGKELKATRVSSEKLDYKQTTNPSPTGLKVSEISHLASDAVNVRQSVSDASQHIREQMKADGVVAAKGVYDPLTDKIWLFADHITSKKEAETLVISHELTHKGLAALGKEGKLLLGSVMIGHGKEITAIVDEAKAAGRTITREGAANEFLAREGETKLNPKLWRRIVDFIKDSWLRMFGVKASDKDVRDALVRVREALDSQKSEFVGRIERVVTTEPIQAPTQLTQQVTNKDRTDITKLIWERDFKPSDKEPLRNKIQNPSFEITVTHKGMGHNKAFSGDTRKLALMEQLREVLKNAVYMYSEPPDARKVNHPTIVAYHKMLIPVNFGEDRSLVFITLQQDDKGNVFYNSNVDSLEIAKPAQVSSGLPSVNTEFQRTEINKQAFYSSIVRLLSDKYNKFSDHKIQYMTATKVSAPFIPITDRTPASYPQYSTAPTAPAGTQRSELAGIVSAANDLSSVNMRVEQSNSALPDSILADMKDRNIVRPEAVTWTDDETKVTHTVFIADNIGNSARMQALLRHEWFHAGVADEELDRLHKYYSGKEDGRLEAIAEARKIDLSTDDGRRHAAGELAAQEAEKGKLNLYVRQLIAKVRKWMNAIGLTDYKFSDYEVADIIRQAIGRVAEVGRNGGFMLQPAYSENKLDKSSENDTMAMIGEGNGTQPGNDERTLGRLGKSKAGDFAAAKDVAGRSYYASPENARARDIRSGEEKLLAEFAQHRDLMLDSEAMLSKVKLQDISGLDNLVYSLNGDYIKINKFTHTGTFADLFINITLHNKIFPEARLNFEGFVQTDNGLRPVFSQEGFINKMPEKSQRLELERLAAEELMRRGFNRVDGTHKSVEQARFVRNDIIVRDISHRNVAYQDGR